MKRFLVAVSLALTIFGPAELRGQGASFGGKKVTQVVDFTGGGVTTAFGSYSTITKVQIAGSQVVFSAYGGVNLDEIAILSANGTSVTPLLEIGRGALANDVSLRLWEFRYLGSGVPLRIPVTAQELNDFPRLMFLSDGSLTEVAGPSTIVPGTSNDRFTQFLGVVAHGDEIAFIGVTTSGERGVYLASGGSIHDLTDLVDQGVQLPGNRIQNRLIFDGSTVYFFHEGDEEGAPPNLYGATLNGEPFLVASGAGEVNDEGVIRSYQSREALAGKTGEVTFLAEIASESIQSQWAFLQTGPAGLKVVARSSSLSPVDEMSLGLSAFWEPFFDGVSWYLGGVNQVYGTGLTSKLQVFPGSPPMFLADIEAGNAALIEASTTPKKIWAELGIVGPVEIPIPPEPQVVEVGGTAVFSVVAEGQGPFTYQWFLNGEFLPLSTSSTLTVRRVSIENVGSVRVVVSNNIDSQEAYASLDVSAPPELVLSPGDRSGVVGESIELMFQTQGQRPITYEFIEAPAGSSLVIAPIQSGEVFDIHAAKSSTLTPGDSGYYNVRVSSPAGVVEFRFHLSVGGIPPNPQFRGKQFEFLTDHHAATLASFPNGFQFSGPVVFDEVNDRFLTSPLVDSSSSLFAISSDGTTTPILGGNALQGISNVQVIGYLADKGIIFQGTQISGNRKTLYAHRNGSTSLLVSASQLQSALGFGPNFSRFEFKVQNGVIVGLVEGSGEWAVVRVGTGITELVSSQDATPMEGADGFLGCDEMGRPLFHTGFEAAPGNPSRTYGPVIQRVEVNGLITRMQAGYLAENEIDPSRFVKAIPSNTGVKYLAWGERLVEIIDRELLVHQLTRTRGGQSIFLPRMEDAYASQYRVFFPGLLLEDEVSKETFLQLDLASRNSDSVRRAVVSWSVHGMSEVFSGRYLDGVRANAGGLGRQPLKLLNVVGDQLLLSGQIEGEGTRSFLMFNQAPDIASSFLSFERSRDGLYLDLPVGTRLQSSSFLSGPWTTVPSTAGSFVIQPSASKVFFTVTPR